MRVWFSLPRSYRRVIVPTLRRHDHSAREHSDRLSARHGSKTAARNALRSELRTRSQQQLITAPQGCVPLAALCCGNVKAKKIFGSSERWLRCQLVVMLCCLESLRVGARRAAQVLSLAVESGVFPYPLVRTSELPVPDPHLCGGVLQSRAMHMDAYAMLYLL